MVPRIFRVTILVTLIAGRIFCATADPDEHLSAYLGPRQAKTYVYRTEGLSDDKVRTVTIAQVPGPNDSSVLLCSPANTGDFPDEVRKRGAQPVISKLEIEGSSIVSRLGHTTNILLQAPLRPRRETWERRLPGGSSDGPKHATVLQCQISETGEREVLGRIRPTVTVKCVGTAPTGPVSVATTYAADLGLIEETMEFFDFDVKSLGKVHHVLSEIRDGADECAALTQTQRAPKGN